MAALTLLAAGCDWPTVGYGWNRAGFSPDTSINAAAVSSPEFGQRWAASTAAGGASTRSSPAVVNGVVYVGAADSNLYALDAKTGAVLWTAATNYRIDASPTVAGGVVYIGTPHGLFAFDAAGTTNCGGTPKTCTPLWSSTVVGTDGAPIVANGIVYITGLSRYLYAFDSAGKTNCSGTPTTCTPIWMSTISASQTEGSPALANGTIYVENAASIYAFDATGASGCSGTPKTCAPLWTAAVTGNPSYFGTPVVVNGILYGGGSDGVVRAYDAAGIKNCSGTPKTCTPLFTAVGNTNPLRPGLVPAVANGILYVTSGDGTLFTFDATGSTNCSGMPKTCTPLWTATGVGRLAPVIANGVLYAVGATSRLTEFDATGTTNCSGTPKTCTPLASQFSTGDIEASPAVANGLVYINTNNGTPPYFGGQVNAYGLRNTGAPTSVEPTSKKTTHS